MGLNPSKALVLGGQNGLLGQALVCTLKSKGWTVEATSSKELDYTSSTFAEDCERIVDQYAPDVIFNTVAYTKVDLAEEHEDKALRVNKIAPLAIGKIAKSKNIKLVHYSTDFVFDGRKGTPYSIHDATSPLCAYGRTKLAGEKALLELEYSKCCIIRTAWLFGPHNGNFVRTMLNLCKDQGKANVVCDQIGSPTYTVDLAAYTLALIDVVDGGLYHIVNSGQASWCELAGEAVRYAMLECSITPVTTEQFPRPAQRPAYSVLDTASFTQTTGISPRPWPQALREYLMLEPLLDAGSDDDGF